MAERELRKQRITKWRREQITAAAGEVFARRGYAAATIPKIAAAAGVAVGTIYNYYPTKRELFIAVIKNLIITVPLLDIIDKMPEADVIVTFRQIFRNRFDLLESDMVAQIPSLMGEIQRDPELKTLWAEQFIRPFFARMEAIYQVMAASGKIRRIEPAIASRALGGLILGFIMLALMEGETGPLKRLPRGEVADALGDFVLHGLAAHEGEKP